MAIYLSDLISSYLSVPHLISAALGAIVGLSAKTLYDRSINRYFTKKGLIVQCEDLERHFIVNKLVTEEIIDNFGLEFNEHIIRAIHLKRMSVLPGEFVFSQQDYRSFPRKQARDLHRIALAIRNIELDVEEAVSIYQNETNESQRNYLLFLRERFRINAKIMGDFLDSIKRRRKTTQDIEAELRKDRKATVFALKKRT